MQAMQQEYPCNGEILPVLRCKSRFAPAKQTCGRPAANRRRGGRRQSGGNGYLVLRIVLIVICVELVGVGIWKIPGNLKMILASHSHSSGRVVPGGNTSQDPSEDMTQSPEQIAAVHEAVEQINAQNDMEHPDVEEPETYVDPTLDQLEAERFYFSTFLQQWLYDEHAEAPDAEEVTAP